MSNATCHVAATGKGPGGYGYEVSHICDLTGDHDLPHHDPRHGDWDACPEQWCRLLADHPLPHRNLSYEPITPGFAHHSTPEQIAAATLPGDGLPGDVPPELKGLRGPFTGLLGPWGIKPDDAERDKRYRDEYTAERDREWRDRAIEHAITALEPVAGAYDRPNLHPGRAPYGDAIIFLAELLGDYIKNGS